MHRLVLATALVTALVGSADAATKKRNYVRAERSVEVQQPVRFQQYQQYPARPLWASPQQCFTDEGYGRFTPCDTGGKGF
jgi:hypothetical protein